MIIMVLMSSQRDYSLEEGVVKSVQIGQVCSLLGDNPVIQKVHNAIYFLIRKVPW